MQIDRADLQLLTLLQQDGRRSVQALSELIHLSPRATLNRVRRLETRGLIQGYRALINRAALGEHIAVFAEIALKDQRQTMVRQFEHRMATTPEVVACYVISGRYDYLARICCRDLTQYHALISAWLDEAALGVEKIVTNIELATVKEFAGFTLG